MNLLFAVHNYPGNGPYYGGTELHVRDLAERLSDGGDHHVFVLYPLDGPDRRVYVVLDTRTKAQQRFELSTPVTWEHYHHAEFAEKIRELIHHHRIDLVHFFHLIHFPLAFPFYVQQAGAAAVIGLFDYYLICRQFNLLTEQQTRFCRFPEVTAGTCDLCLRQTYGYAPGSQARRRQYISEILFHADAIHYLCEDQRWRFLEAYPHLADREELVMGLGMKAALPMAPSTATMDGAKSQAQVIPTEDRPLQVACIGNFARQKGAELLIGVFDHYGLRHALGRPKKIHFHVFGKAVPPYDSAEQMLARSEVVTLHGHYKASDLPRLLRSCDVALFASIWPETFALVLSEAWASGLVPVGPRLGAFGERIQDGINGLSFDVLDDPGGVIAALDSLAEDPNRLATLQANVRSTPILTLDENVRRYEQLWGRVIATIQDNPEAAVRRAEALERASIIFPTTFWHAEGPPSALPLLPGASPAAQHSTRLLDRAWGVYKRHGLGYTVRTAINYRRILRVRRGERA